MQKKDCNSHFMCGSVDGTIGCGNSTASAKTTPTQTDKKEDYQK